ncbi:hypothetical protein [Klenkia sp. PcliD-1-E]|uniref:hypothetical protein n=1 Tax=Klenkia sp. PcliD-1-E TaxID=2954492 RepID=UPI002096EF25|nr:hypothetical protein [Klenkia sp. PcliD-1-E]MCO7219245.1 hypothetical protein [Klenkia sp. PcliD-1-E]
MTALGERILTELGEAETTDTLTRWLTHHAARIMDAADRARAAGEPDADARDAEARAAILELWRHRSSWPSGWPPSRAAAIVELLEGLPDLEDPAWFRVSAIGRLQDLHHHVLAVLADLVSASADGVEEGWLQSFGDQLTPDEMTLLTRAAGAPRRLNSVLRGGTSSLDQLRRRLALGGSENVDEEPAENTDAGESTSAKGPGVLLSSSHRLVQLADAYRDVVKDLLRRAGSASSLGQVDDDVPWTGDDNDPVIVG